MMQFDKRDIHSIKYTFRIVVTLPDLSEEVFDYDGESYETYLDKIREARVKIENLYNVFERREVTEF
jgi:hypothetical protein